MTRDVAEIHFVNQTDGQKFGLMSINFIRKSARHTRRKRRGCWLQSCKCTGLPVSDIHSSKKPRFSMKASGVKASKDSKYSRKRLCIRKYQSPIRKVVSIKAAISDLAWIDEIPECPVYTPSKEEFDDPLVYLEKIAQEASKYGICKIVSPFKASVPARDVLMKENKDFSFTTIVQPLRLASQDVNDEVIFERGRKYTYKKFEKQAKRAHFSPKHFPFAASLEKLFWYKMIYGKKGAVNYAANIDGSAFSCDPNDHLGRSKWNLNAISQLPNSTLRLLKNRIPGITDPMLYMGMQFGMFTWHVEDHYLYSINYHHTGAPKTWYGVPGHAASTFERVALNHLHADDIRKTNVDAAFKILARKTTMFPPNILQNNHVPVYKSVQKSGEFVITFPRAYHAGFSHGFNCGEAVNFAIGDWFPLGAVASRCYARLKMMPILPYEKLLCEEAMILYKSSKNELTGCPCSESDSHRSLKLSFVHLIGFYRHVIWHLNNLRESFSTLPKTQEISLCSLCSRDSYLACLMCNCGYFHYVCLFHEFESLCCPGGGQYTLYIHDNILEMKDAARLFEKELQDHVRGRDLDDAKLLGLNSITCIKDAYAFNCKSTCRGRNVELSNLIVGKAEESGRRDGEFNLRKKVSTSTTCCRQLYPRACKRPTIGFRVQKVKAKFPLSSS